MWNRSKIHAPFIEYRKNQAKVSVTLCVRIDEDRLGTLEESWCMGVWGVTWMRSRARVFLICSQSQTVLCVLRRRRRRRRIEIKLQPNSFRNSMLNGFSEEIVRNRPSGRELSVISAGLVGASKDYHHLNILTISRITRELGEHRRLKKKEM